MKTRLLRLGGLALGAYTVLIMGVAGCQSSLLYFPSQAAETELLRRAKGLGVEPWRDRAGRLAGWYRPNPEAGARLVVFCGNAGDALDRIGLIDAFGSLGDGRDWEVWVVEYPGYGGRAGTPGKEAFIRAGREALDQLRAADRRPIHLLGESIGSGTASALAGELRSGIAGLLLLVPFARLEEVAREKFPYLPVRLLLRDKFDNVAALADFTGPAVFVVATRDEVVGADQGRKLAQSYRGPGLLVELPGAGHNDHRAGPTAEWVVRGSAFLLGRTP